MKKLYVIGVPLLIIISIAGLIFLTPNTIPDKWLICDDCIEVTDPCSCKSVMINEEYIDGYKRWSSRLKIKNSFLNSCEPCDLECTADLDCQLSMCDCACHKSGETREELEGVMCGINCLGEFNVSSCACINNKCIAVNCFGEGSMISSMTGPDGFPEDNC